MEQTLAIELNWFWKGCVRALPSRMKRLILMASLIGYAKKVTDDDERAIDSINQLLHLASDRSALRLPMRPRVYHAIWNHGGSVVAADIDVLISKSVERNERIEHAYRIANAIPTWFRYSTNVRDIANDILQLFEFDRSPASRMFRTT